MTKYAKCGVCGYVIAIYDDTDASDYVCPVDGTTLVVATRTEYMVTLKLAATFIVAASDSLHKERADYVCPGVDDQVVIQAAIDVLSPLGGMVKLLEGTYSLSSTIYPKSGTILEGMGYSTYLIGSGIRIESGVLNIVIDNLRINSELNSGHTIYIDNASNIVVKNCFVYGGKDDAISITANNGNTTNVGIRYNYVNKSVNDFEASGGPSGIEVGDDAEGVTIEGNYVTGSVTGGAITGIKANSHEYSDPPENVKIINNIIENIDGPGIIAEMWGGTVSGNILLNVSTDGMVDYPEAYGILIYGHDITCDGNVIDTTGGTGTGIAAGGGGDSYNLVVTNNRVYNAGGVGIKFTHHDHICIGNLVKNSGTLGIRVGSNNTIVSNCKIIDSGNHGLFIQANYVSIENCYVYGSDGSAIFVDGSHVQVSGCDLKNSYGHWDSCGIWLNGDYIEIINNHIYDGQTPKTQTFAIGTVSVINNITIAFNELIGNKDGPFYIWSPGSITDLKYFEPHSDLFMDVLGVSATHVRSNEDLSVATPITFTITAQPDIPRTLSGHFDSHAQITAYTIVITGTDAKGNTVTETFTEAASPWDFETVNAYATITSIIMTARTGTGAGDTMDIGITDVLGLSNIIDITSDVYKIKKNNANATVAAAQVNTTYDTYDMAVIGLAATDDFTIWFKSNLNIIS